ISGPSSGNSTGHGEPSLHSLDIDGIIQSFVKEQESTHPIQPANLNQNSATHEAGIVQQPYIYQPANPMHMDTLHLMNKEDSSVDNFPYEVGTSWPSQGMQ